MNNMAEAVDIAGQLTAERKRVDVENFDCTVRELLSMAAKGELKRAPEYQRKFRWDEEKESRFIESVLLGLPVPSIFVATNPDGTWEIVDGLQRISTLIHFVADPEKDKLLREVNKQFPLKLSSLKKLSHFNKMSHEDLPMPLQMSFAKRMLRVTSLSDKADPDVRFDTFERLNTGGIVLSAQEVRSCIYRGAFNDLLRDLAQNETFVRLVKLQKAKQQDGTREEIVLKFFAYLHNRNEFSGQVKEFLNNYMSRASKEFDTAKGKAIFESAVEHLGSVITGPFLRSGTNVTPVNQFEAVLVAIGQIKLDGKRYRRPPSDWLNDEDLVKYSTKGTNDPNFLNGRINRAKNLFLGKA
jgi:Protein of unknown function DUF262